MKKLSDKNIAILAIGIIVIVSGAGPVFTKIALRELSPEYFSFLRFLIASLVILPLFYRNKVKLNKDLLILIMISLILTINILSFSYGVRLTTATISQLLYALGPVFIAIFSYFLLKEKISNNKILGIILGMLGAGLVIILPVIQKSNPFSGNLIGNVIVLMGVFLTALYSALSKKLHIKFSPIQIAMVFFLTTCFVMLALSLPQIVQDPNKMLSISPKALFGVLYVGAITTPLLYVLYQYAIKHGSPLIASTNFFLSPFSTLIWAGIILGEKLTPLLAVGGVLVLFGTYFIVKSSKKSEIDIEP